MARGGERGWMGGDVSGGLQERCIYAGIAVASSDRKLLIYILSSNQNVAVDCEILHIVAHKPGKRSDRATC